MCLWHEKFISSQIGQLQLHGHRRDSTDMTTKLSLSRQASEAVWCMRDACMNDSTMLSTGVLTSVGVQSGCGCRSFIAFEDSLMHMLNIRWCVDGSMVSQLSTGHALYERAGCMLNTLMPLIVLFLTCLWLHRHKHD